MPAVITLYRTTDDPYGVFLNFARIPVTARGLEWPSSEALFQAGKFPRNQDYQEQIRLAPTPAAAAALGRNRDVAIRPDWDLVRDEVMWRVQVLKFTQHRRLRDLLVSTGDAILIEHSRKDRYWGNGGDGTGLNVQGKILMGVRREVAEGRL